MGLNENNSNYLETALIQGESVHCSLPRELELRLNKYSSDLVKEQMGKDLELKLDTLEQKIFNWVHFEQAIRNYTSCQLRLQINAQKLRLDLRKKTQAFIKKLWRTIPPENCLQYLENLEKISKNQVDDFQCLKKDYLLREKSLRKACAVLKSLVLDAQEITDDYYCWTKALLKLYVVRIQIEVLNLASQALKSVIHTIQFYIDILIQTISDLSKIRKQCLSDVNNLSMLPVLFEQMCLTTTPEQLKQELQSQLRCELNNWGNFDTIYEQKVKELLWEKVNPISQTINQQMMNELSLLFESSK